MSFSKGREISVALGLGLRRSRDKWGACVPLMMRGWALFKVSGPEGFWDVG